MWTTEKTIKQQLEKEWQKGIFLSELFNEQSLFPFKLKLVKPTNQDITEHFSLVRNWVNKLSGLDFIKIKWKTIQHRIQGEQRIPESIWVDNIDILLKILKKKSEYQQFQTLITQTKKQQPLLLAWLVKYPFKSLAVYEEWEKLLAIITWLHAHPQPHIYLRQVDIPNVHSKFIEQHRGILTELFDIALPLNAIQQEFRGISQFNARYGFLDKPRQIRFRNLDPKRSIFPNILQSDLSLDVESFAALKPTIQRVIIVENEISYLSLPYLDNTWAIWGAGYGWQTLSQVNWLRHCEIYYWGDIDTHGFAILSRLRQHFPQVVSILMDKATLLTHQPLWSVEEKPNIEQFVNLTDDEQAIYQALQHHQFGQNVRLEQELISFSIVEKYLKNL